MQFNCRWRESGSVRDPLNLLQVGNEGRVSGMALLSRGCSQDGRRVDCRCRVRRPWMFDEAPALFGDAPGWPEDSLCSGGAQTNQNRGFYHSYFGFEPWFAGFQFSAAGLLVNAAFAALLEFEVLYGIGQVDCFPIDARLDKGAVEHASRGSDERPALAVFFITRLLPDHYDGSRSLALAEYRLRRVFV